MNESLFRKLKKVRLQDLGHLILFLLALLPARIYRCFRPHLWLVCESGTEARDNGYWFFKYLREQQPQVDAAYAIRGDCPEYGRVAPLGPVVPFGSFRHWIWYLAAEVNISSQKYGKPNAAVCYLMEVVLGWLKNRRVFLQHGVIKDDLPFLHEEKAKFSFFSCGALPEYEFVRGTFGYPPGVVQYVGLCRFDALHGVEPDRDLVLIVPTWRMYLERSGGEEGRKTFLESHYYQGWRTLLQDGRLDALLARYGKRAVFCTHRNMEAFEDCFTSPSERIRVLRWRDADVSALIRQAGVLITDFSSIYMDFAYMKKPVLYYQFDTEEFRQGHLPAGYFDYERDGFGPVCSDAGQLLREAELCFANGCQMAERYEARVDRFYTIHDDKNSERTYLAIRRMLAGGGGWIMTEQQSQIYEVLKTFVRICEDRGLRYFLTGGTLLGAVRHQGFIPWDDDVDVVMPEADYLRFLQLKDSLPASYVLQNEETDPDFPFLYSKLCNTAVPFISQYASAPKGANIDIFYMIPSRPLNAETKLAFSQVKLIDYALRAKLGWREYIPNGRAARAAYRALLMLPVQSLRALRLQAAARIADPAGDTLCCIGGPYHARQEFFPKPWYENAVELPFEDMRCCACQGWDAWLTQHYGDYMQLPEMDKRVSHHEQADESGR